MVPKAVLVILIPGYFLLNLTWCGFDNIVLNFFATYDSVLGL